MPKEVVHKPGTDGVFQVVVGWSQDNDVQVGIESDDGRSFAWLFFGDHLEQIGIAARRSVENNPATDTNTGTRIANEAVARDVLNELDTLGCDANGTYNSVWTHHSRYTVNQLIRLLRRARDSAFGADA